MFVINLNPETPVESGLIGRFNLIWQFLNCPKSYLQDADMYQIEKQDEAVIIFRLCEQQSSSLGL